MNQVDNHQQYVRQYVRTALLTQYRARMAANQSRASYNLTLLAQLVAVFMMPIESEVHVLIGAATALYCRYIHKYKHYPFVDLLPYHILVMVAGMAYTDYLAVRQMDEAMSIVEFWINLIAGAIFNLIALATIISGLMYWKPRLDEATELVLLAETVEARLRRPRRLALAGIQVGAEPVVPVQESRFGNREVGRTPEQIEEICKLHRLVIVGEDDRELVDSCAKISLPRLASSHSHQLSPSLPEQPSTSVSSERSRRISEVVVNINVGIPGASAQQEEKEGKQEKETKEVCTVCLGDLDPPLLHTLCNHKFHHECIGGWLVHHDLCPICRNDLTATPGRPDEAKNTDDDSGEDS